MDLCPYDKFSTDDSDGSVEGPYKSSTLGMIGYLTEWGVEPLVQNFGLNVVLEG